MNARCRPGQKTGCNSVEEFFKVMVLYHMLAAIYQHETDQ